MRGTVDAVCVPAVETVCGIPSTLCLEIKGKLSKGESIDMDQLRGDLSALLGALRTHLGATHVENPETIFGVLDIHIVDHV